MRLPLVIASLSLVLAGCSGGTPSLPSVPSGNSSESASPGADTVVQSGTCDPTFKGVCSRVAVRQVHGVAFTPMVACSYPGLGTKCRLAMDITAPTSGGPWPLIVLLWGGPSAPGERNPLTLDPFAKALAGQGAVVMVADWRQGSGWGGGYPTSFGDVACAIGVARKIGPAYGAAPDRVTLVGASTGGWPAAVLGLTPSAFAPAPKSCDPTAGSLRPDRVVSMAGEVNEVSQPNQADSIAYVQEFFGGPRRDDPEAWAASDPFVLLRRYPAGANAIPFLLVQGLSDTVVAPAVSRSFQAALVTAGYQSRLVEVPGITHLHTWENGNAVDAVASFVSGK